ncbi:hypothetical protein LQF12_13485 [Ruania suaedae]|uniref:hypothetical protein n=1 Tax=Ruania suaedae TaxID=2897774 RepID=UPI001E3E7E68|nr:hypothetical protein [Ruania suaedae]UFU02492.1 hypothetical protein LQF12_13485 [Ruania suaedae]
MTTIDAHSAGTVPLSTEPTPPHPVRDSLLPATLSLLAVLALLTGFAIAAGTVVRVVAGYVIG